MFLIRLNFFRKNSRLKGVNQTSPQNSSQFSPAGSITSPLSSPKSVPRANSTHSQLLESPPTNASVKLECSESSETFYQTSVAAIDTKPTGAPLVGQLSSRITLDLPVSNESFSTVNPSAFKQISPNPLLSKAELPTKPFFVNNQAMNSSSVLGNELFKANEKYGLSPENYRFLLQTQATIAEQSRMLQTSIATQLPANCENNKIIQQQQQQQNSMAAALPQNNSLPSNIIPNGNHFQHSII